MFFIGGRLRKVLISCVLKIENLIISDFIIFYKFDNYYIVKIWYFKEVW